MGLRNDVQLGNFANSVQSIEVNGWAKAGLMDHSALNFPEAFAQATDKVIKSGGKIKFDLTGFDMAKALKSKGKSLYSKGVGYTDWEFNQILQNKRLLNSTEFYENGVKKKTSDILKKASGGTQ